MPHALLCMLSRPQCSCLSLAEVALPSQAGSAHPFMPLLLPAFTLLAPDTLHLITGSYTLPEHFLLNGKGLCGHFL